MTSIAVLINVYNEEKYLGRCLESIESQTLAPSRVVVVDNASTDRSYAICNNYNFSRSSLLAVRNKSNLGALRSVDLGLSLIDEEFVLVLGAHDYLHPDYLRRASSIACLSNSYGLVYTANIRISEDGAFLRCASGGDLDSGASGIDSLVHILQSGIDDCTAVNGFYRTSALKACRRKCGFKPDKLLLLRLASRYEIKKIDECLYFRREFGGKRRTSSLERLTGRGRSLLVWFELFANQVVFVFHVFAIYVSSPRDSLVYKIYGLPGFCSGLETSFGLFSLRKVRLWLASKNPNRS